MVFSRYFRNLAGKERSADANRHLGFSLAFIAGATNAGGFLAVHQYTSHMSGIVSAIADDAMLRNFVPALAGVAALAAFTSGAACSAILVNWGRRQGLQSQYASPLVVEAALLLGFGLLGSQLAEHRTFFAPVTVLLLCFIMGLQNAMITKLSNAEIRTTHITGMVTDIGIELGKLFYWNRNRVRDVADAQLPVIANRSRLRVLTAMLAAFFGGGLAGAIGFKHVGYASTLPLAAFLIVLAIVPLIDDVRAQLIKIGLLASGYSPPKPAADNPPPRQHQNPAPSTGNEPAALKTSAADTPLQKNLASCKKPAEKSRTMQ